MFFPSDPHEFWMREALKAARISADQGEIPIGAVLVQGEKVLASSHNLREDSKNPLHHAEILVLEKAAAVLKDWRFTDTRLYVTVEPCPMCLGALLQARVGEIIFGCFDPKRRQLSFETEDKRIEFPSLKGITAISGNNHSMPVSGPVLEEECSTILKDFFKNRRNAGAF